MFITELGLRCRRIVQLSQQLVQLFGPRDLGTMLKPIKNALKRYFGAIVHLHGCLSFVHGNCLVFVRRVLYLSNASFVFREGVQMRPRPLHSEMLKVQTCSGLGKQARFRQFVLVAVVDRILQKLKYA